MPTAVDVNFTANKIPAYLLSQSLWQVSIHIRRFSFVFGKTQNVGYVSRIDSGVAS